MTSRFYLAIGWPLYRLRRIIGMEPYNWSHLRWLRAWCAENGLR